MNFKLHVTPENRNTQMYENVDYKEFWEGIERQHLDVLEKTLVKDMLEFPARRLVDIGCGFGRLWECYGQGSQEIIMVDSSISQLQEAQKIPGIRATFIASDAQNLPFQAGAFDRVLMVRLLHHLPDTLKSLSEMQRILCDSGRVVFTFCNKRNLKYLLKWALHKSPINPFSVKTEAVWEPLSMHHPAYIRQSLTALDFIKVKVRGVGIMDKIAGKAKKLWKFVPHGIRLAPIFGNLYLAPWIFIAANKTGSRTPFLNKPIAELFQCPNCGGYLTSGDQLYHCEPCSRNYPIIDDIIDFRLS